MAKAAEVGDCRLCRTHPAGFAYVVLGNDVLITHHDKRATTLRGAAATEFLADVQDDNAQEFMARLTGNYKHGNERTAKHHPRNKGR